jgi:predicted nucleic acid-binding protein
MNLYDTNIIIEMIKQKKYHTGAISPLTLIEVLRGIDETKRLRVKELLEESFAVINLDNSIIVTYCEIYSKLKLDGNSLPDADLLIAATAIAHNLTLETTDEHFQRLKQFNLKIK